MPKGLKQLTIEDFKGKNLKSDPSDMTNHQCQTIDNFEISYIFGRLTKSTGYELATDVIGSNYTTTDYLSCDDGTISSLTKVFEWGLDRDSPNDYKYISYYNVSGDDMIGMWDNDDSQWEQLNTNTDAGTYLTCNFYNRDSALIIGAGISTTTYPGYVKYFGTRSIFGQTDNQTFGYKHYRNSLNFDDSVFTFVATDDYTDGGWMEESIISYYMSPEYDDGQIGSISDAKARIRVENNDAVKLTITISETDGDDINRRITGIYIYRAINDDKSDTPYATGDGTVYYKIKGQLDWQQAYLLFYMPLDNNEELLPGILEGNGSVTDTDLATSMNSWASVANGMLTGMFCELETDGTKEYKRVVTTNTDSVVLESAPSGGNGSYNFRFVPYWYKNSTNYELNYTDRKPELVTTVMNHINRSSKECPNINWKYAVFHSGRGFYAPIYLVDDVETHKNWIGVSNINGAGNYEYDNIIDYINLSEFGVTEITGLGLLLNNIIVFSKSDIHKLNISSGNQFSWTLEETLDNVGCIAPDSIIYISGDQFKISGYYYVSGDGIRVYDGYKSSLISTVIEDEDNYPIGVTDLTEAVAGYNDRLKQYWVSFPTDNKIIKYDLRTGEFLDSSLTDSFDSFSIDHNGNFMGVSSNKVFVFNNDGSSDLTDFNGTDIEPSWKSKVYDFGSPGVEKILHEISVRYKSDTDISVQYYIDGGSANDFNGDDQFPSSTDMTVTHIGFPIGSRCYTLEIGVSLTSTDMATNTYIDIDEIRIYYEDYQSGRE